MEQEFELWRHREYGAQAEYQGAFEIAGLHEAFLAGAEIQKRKDVEIAKDGAMFDQQYPTDYDYGCMDTATSIAQAIERSE